MTAYRLRSTPAADRDIEAVFVWYERQRKGLGTDFIQELEGAYGRILGGPLRYQDLRRGIRRVLLRRFPYAVYFAMDAGAIVILTVLHAGRDPAQWQLHTYSVHEPALSY